MSITSWHCSAFPIGAPIYAALPLRNGAADRDAVMNRTEIEQLTDELIGEAVLSLLRENGPISTQTLITRLQSMANSAADKQRRDTITAVITEIENNALMVKQRTTNGNAKEWNGFNRDGTYPLFTTNRKSGAGKKH